MSTPFSANPRSVTIVIRGEAASKANSRRIVFRGRRPRSIKSVKALSYSEMFRKQCPTLTSLLKGDLKVEMVIYYASRRPDLDESLVLDLMQEKIYLNDRQVKEKHIYHGLDRQNPRAEITVSELESQNQRCDTGHKRPRARKPKAKD